MILQVKDDLIGNYYIAVFGLEKLGDRPITPLDLPPVKDTKEFLVLVVKETLLRSLVQVSSAASATLYFVGKGGGMFRDPVVEFLARIIGERQVYRAEEKALGAAGKTCIIIVSRTVELIEKYLKSLTESSFTISEECGALSSSYNKEDKTLTYDYKDLTHVALNVVKLYEK